MAVRLRNFSFRGGSIVRSVFIETGTYRGISLFHAFLAGFERLHSIEVHEPHYQAAKRIFADVEGVSLHLGTSPAVLQRIIDPAKATTFWLDAHFVGGNRCEQDPTFGECPLLAELDVIRSFSWKTDPLLLIDDAHMFDGKAHQGFDHGHWPTTRDIVERLPANYEMGQHDGILYCVPRGFPSA